MNDNEVEEFIKHYSSPFYDPKKAHEYYLRTRQLKGRTQFSTKNFTGKQREAWTYIKKGVADKKHAQTDQARAIMKHDIAAARQKSTALRKALSAQLRGLYKNLPPEAKKAARAKLTTDLNAVIDQYRAKYKLAKNAASASATASLAKEYKNVKTKVR